MTQATEQDLGPLTWVKSEIDQALAQALGAIDQAAQNEDERTSKLQFAQTHLHQARGALSIIGLDGLTQFTDGLDKLIGELARGERELTEDMVDLCRRAFSATGNYLDELSHGAPDQPLRLAPLHARIALARGADAPGEGDLFYPNTSVNIPRRAAPPPLDSADEQRLLRWLRVQFQRGLLAWLRKPDEPTGAKQMREAVAGIESRQTQQQARAFWLGAAAFCEALAEGHVTVTPHIRRICGRIDAQIRRLMSGTTHFPERLHRDTMYVVARAPAASPLVKALHNLYRLPTQLPPPNSAVSELPLGPMLAGLREQLNHAKDAWDQFAEGTAAALPSFEERMGKLATASRKLGRPAFVRLMTTLSAFAQWLRKDPMRVNDAISMEVASALLLADHALDSGRVPDASFSSQVEDTIARIEACSRGETVADQDASASARQAQERSAIMQLCKEMQASLAQVEQTLDAFFRAPEKREGLASVRAPIQQIEAILTLLDETDACDTLSDCEAMIERLADPTQDADTELFEPLADLLSGLGFYIDSLARGRPDKYHLTGEIEEEPEIAEVPVELAPATEAVPAAALPPEVAAMPVVAPGGNEGRIEHEEDQPEAPVPVPAPSSEAAQLLDASEEEIDAELLEIFIEEAREVLGNIETNLAAARANPANADALTTVRRGFHTLKGSGRMVGLNALGEVAWDMEQTLNRWLQLDWKPSDALLDLIGDSHGLFQAWVEQLASGGSTNRDDTAPISQRAQQLAAAQSPNDTGALDEGSDDEAGMAETVDLDVTPDTEPEPEAEPELLIETALEPLVETELEPIADFALPTEFEPVPTPEPALDAGPDFIVDGTPPEDSLTSDTDAFDALDDSTFADAPAPAADAGTLQETSLDFSDLEATDLSMGDSLSSLNFDSVIEPPAIDLESTVIEPLEPLEAMDDPLAPVEAIDFPDLVTEADLPDVASTPVPTDPMAETTENVELPALDALADSENESDLEFDLELNVEPMEIPAAPEGSDVLGEFLVQTDAEEAATADAMDDEDALDLDFDLALEPSAEAAIEGGLDLGDLPTESVVPESTADETPLELPDTIDLPEAPETPDVVEDLLVPVASGVSDTPMTDEVPLAEVAETPIAEPEPPADDTVTVGSVTLSRPLYTLYLNESKDHLAVLRHESAQLQNNPTRIPQEEAVRAAHTLAGISGTAGFEPTQTLGRALEHALARLCATGTPPTAEQTALLSTASTTMDAMIGEIRNGTLPLSAPVLEAQLDSLLRTPIVSDDIPELDEAMADEGIDLSELAPPNLDIEASVAQVPEPAPEPATAKEAPETHDVQDDIDEQLLPIFIEEALDLLAQLNSTMRQWRDDTANEEHHAAVARLLHTIKGSSRMTGAMSLGEHLHALEGQLEAAKSIGPELLDELEQGLDVASQYVDRLARGETAATLAPTPMDVEPETTSGDAPATAPVAPAAVTIEADEGPGAAGGTLRVRADLVDRFVNEAGEIGIARTRVEGELRTQRRALLDLTENVIRLRNQLREVEIQADIQMQSRMAQAESQHANFDPLEMDRYTRLQELTRMMAESVNDVTTVQHALLRNLDQADAALVAQSRQTRTLQQALMSVRMTPFDSLADRLYRVVRQSAKDLGKRANLDLRGGRIELDRSVLERITSPLEHLLRNAVAHGIEAPDLRRESRKPELGQITLNVRHEGNEVVVEMMDDGAGLNFERIEARAREAGLIGAGETVDERRLTNMIFMPGFSTAGELSAVSGRGVGMDVVKAETAAVGGRIEVTSSAGVGSTFRLYLPLTLAVTQALLVRAGGRTFAIPSNMVAQVLELKADALAEIQAAGTTHWLGNDYSYTYLPRLLGDNETQPEVHRFNWVLLLRSGTQTLAVHVDALRGNQEIVVKKAGPQLARLVGYTGATVLGDGEIVLIINPVALAGVAGDISASGHAGIAPAAEAAHAPTVMVVDDSLTVRKITSRLLEREGYTVVTAKDGVDALEQLLEDIPDVILSDIEMPRMDGFDLARNIRNDVRLKTVPIIMITSRLADKHREYAAQIGVNHYLGKPYQEDELLALIGEYAEAPR